MTITADTALFTNAADFAGHTVLDSFLGTATPEEACDGLTLESLETMLLTTATDYLRDGSAFLEEDALVAANEEGQRAFGRIESPTRFTIRRVAAEIWADAHRGIEP